MTASTPPPPGGPPRFDHDCDACVFLGAYYRVGLGLTWCVYTCPTCDSNMVPAPAPKRATCPTCDRLRAEGIDPASMTPKEIRDADAYAH